MLPSAGGSSAAVLLVIGAIAAIAYAMQAKKPAQNSSK
jgi:hypothetical protein